MDYPMECSFWKLNKYLLTFYGLWPYQSKLSMICSYFIHGCWMFSCMIPLLKGFEEEALSSELVVFFESVVALVMITGGVALCSGLRFHMDRITELYDQIAADWERTTEPGEVAILKDYSRRGKRLILIYLGTFTGTYVWFFSLTYVPLLVNKGVTTSLLRSYPYYSESWIISERFHILQVFLHENLGLCYAMYVYIATTSMFISSVTHICGMFEIVCYRLRKLTTLDITVKTDNEVMTELLDIIAKHEEAINGVRILGKLFGPTLFIVEISILLSLALIFFDFTYSIDISMILLARVAFIAFIFTEYLFYLNYGGQLIIEYSNKVLTSTYFMRWYLLSTDARKMLLMILLRSSRSNILNAGIMTLSLENFTHMIKMSWSFACVLLSSQKKYSMNEPDRARYMI